MRQLRQGVGDEPNPGHAIFTRSKNPSRQPLDDARRRVQRELAREGTMTMIEDGWEALEATTGEHMGSVGVLAVHFARRDGLTHVEKTHVERAHAHIGSRPRATVSIFITSTLGGLFGGVGGGTLGSIYIVDACRRSTDPLFIFSLVMSLIGLALVITSIAITIVSRRR
jgi:hypothetical protein